MCPEKDPLYYFKQKVANGDVWFFTEESETKSIAMATT